MKEIERMLCKDCQATLIHSGLRFKRVTDYEMPDDMRCAWCHRERALKRYRIQYARGRG